MGKAHFHANFFEAARVVLDDRKVKRMVIGGRGELDRELPARSDRSCIGSGDCHA